MQIDQNSNKKLWKVHLLLHLIKTFNNIFKNEHIYK